MLNGFGNNSRSVKRQNPKLDLKDCTCLYQHQTILGMISLCILLQDYQDQKEEWIQFFGVVDRFKEIMRLHRLPRTIVSNQDTSFVSHFWKVCWNKLGIELMFTTSHHPQTDGKTEVVNQTLSVKSYPKFSYQSMGRSITAC